MECTKDIECLRELTGAAVCPHNGIDYTDGQSWKRVSAL